MCSLSLLDVVVVIFIIGVYVLMCYKYIRKLVLDVVCMLGVRSLLSEI